MVLAICKNLLHHQNQAGGQNKKVFVESFLTEPTQAEEETV